MTWKPIDAVEAATAVADALSEGKTLELIGGGSRRAFGRPVEADVVLDLSALSGVVTYQPEELILAAAPGTPMAEIEALLAARGQQLAFEPPDLGPLWGLPAGLGTLGGAIMTGRGGPRRLSVGGPRDHCLGVKGVNGFGEAFAAGGRVVKNVTGFDLPKLITGSFGTLCVATELTVKVLPAASDTATLVLLGLSDEAAVAAMSQALGSPAQVSAAAHLPADIAGTSSVAGITGQAAATLLRLEGVRPSVAARVGHLAQALETAGPQILLDREPSLAIWKEIADAAFFAKGADTVVWKLSVAPTLGAALGNRLAGELSGRCYYDWGGGAVWLELADADDAHAAVVRRALQEVAGGDGHATLMRAPFAVRATEEPFQPLGAAVAALTERVRAQFDPQGIFNPGRMYGGL